MAEIIGWVMPVRSASWRWVSPIRFRAAKTILLAFIYGKAYQDSLVRTSAKRSTYVSTTRGQVYVDATNSAPDRPNRSPSAASPASSSQISANSEELP